MPATHYSQPEAIPAQGHDSTQHVRIEDRGGDILGVLRVGACNRQEEPRISGAVGDGRALGPESLEERPQW